MRQHLDATSINATVYLATATLRPIFQDRIDQQVPGAVSNAINGVVSTLPAADQGWALQMANTLIQPSAELTDLSAQQGGLATSLRVNLYPGDPQPINANMLIKFSVLNASTVQVSVVPVNGSPTLVNGPISTFNVPFGSLNGVSTTPGCGDSALAVNLQFPISLGTAAAPQTSAQAQQGQLASSPSMAMIEQPALKQGAAVGAGVNSYVEIPASSLASLGSSIGSLPISKNLSAQNIQVSISGSNLVINSDIYLDTSFKIGTATTTVVPTAESGGLAVHVLDTTLTIFQLLTFPYNTYNQQIEQTLNSKLDSALAGKFNVTNAAIGANSHVPCAAGDSLVLTGTTSLA